MYPSSDQFSNTPPVLRVIYYVSVYSRRRSRSRGSESRDRSQDKEYSKTDYSVNSGKRRFTEGSPTELTKRDIPHPEASLAAA